VGHRKLRRLLEQPHYQGIFELAAREGGPWAVRLVHLAPVEEKTEERGAGHFKSDGN
jgi:hypothetical protein